VALALQPGANNFFRSAGGLATSTQWIHISGINEIDPTGGGSVQDGVTTCLIALQTKRHGSETKSGDPQARAAEFLVSHGWRQAPLCSGRIDRGCVIIGIGNVFEPYRPGTVVRDLLECEMDEHSIRRRAMPMPDMRRNEHRVAGTKDYGRTALHLHPA
jgi:hypothetical protein